MKTSNYLLLTQREIPADAEIVSHQLMLRAGLIRKVASGLYSWLPTGIRVLRKIEKIIREEMDALGAIEVSMPIVQPSDLWHESGRWEQYGQELLRINDRNQRSFVLGPTHEEVVTALIRDEVSSYKQLPLTLYQIQTKFRDEVRPRFGMMRSRELLMKDAYSFHNSQESLDETYKAIFQTYCKIFSRMGLEFRPVQADTGSIGGNKSHEFQVLARNGEDKIAVSTDSHFAANLELAEAMPVINADQAPLRPMELVAANGSLSDIKIYLVEAVAECKEKFVAILLKSEHELNEIKAGKCALIKQPLRYASAEETRDAIGASAAYAGPVRINVPMIIDRSVALLRNFTAGANIEGQFYTGINWGRDVAYPEIADLRNVVEGDPSPDGKGTLVIRRGIEVGHIFQLGTKYTEAMHAKVQGVNGEYQPVVMGCYGIGVSRLVAAVIEQSHDQSGIIWHESLSPFDVAIIPIAMDKSISVATEAEMLYETFRDKGLDVLLDDRKERPGVKFADIDLIGIPHVFIISERSLAQGVIEYKDRRTGRQILVEMEKVTTFMMDIISKRQV